MMKDVFKDLVKYLPSYIVPGIAGIVAIPIVTQLFPPEDYGNYVLVLAGLSILSAFGATWLRDSVIRFFPTYDLHNRVQEFDSTIIKLTLIAVGATSVVTLTILHVVLGRTSRSLLYLMRIGLLVFVTTSFFTVFLSSLRARRQVGRYSSFMIWRSAAGLGCGIAIVMAFRVGVEGLLWGSFLSTAIVLPLLWRITIGKFSFHKGSIRSPMASKMMKYGLPVIVVTLTSWIIVFSDRYVLEVFWGSGDVGIYSAGYAISQRSIFTVMLLLGLASRPIAVSIWEKQGVEASQTFLAEITRYSLLIGLPASVGLSVLSKPVMRILTTPAYFPGHEVIPLIAFSGFLLGLTRGFVTVLDYYRRTDLIMLGQLICAALNLGLNFLLVPRYGYRAAAATTLAAYGMSLLIHIALSRRFLVWQFPFKSLGKIAIASAALGVIAYQLGNRLSASDLTNSIGGILVGAVVYLAILLLLREIRPEEIRETRLLALRAVGLG